MVKPRLFNSIFFLVFLLLVQDVLAQDYIRWGLPAGARARLGKGRISGDIAFSPNSALLAAPSSIGTWLYDAHTGAEIALLSGRGGHVYSVSFSPDGATLASAAHGLSYGLDGRIWLWDVASGRLKGTLNGHTSGVRRVVYSPDGSILAGGSLAVGGLDGKVELWDVASGRFKGTIEDTFGIGGLRAGSFSPDGGTLVMSIDVKTLGLWNVGSGQLKAILRGFRPPVVYSPDGSTLASSSSDNTVRLWDVGTGELQAVLEGHREPVTTLAYSPDGRILASGSKDRTIRLWEVRTGELLGPPRGGHREPVTTLAYSPDGRILASGSEDRTVVLRDGVTGGLQKVLEGHEESVRKVLFSPDGSVLASTSNRIPRVRLWDVATGQLKATIGGEYLPISFMSYSPDGGTLAGVGRSAVRLWEASTGQLKATLKGHTDRTSSVSYSPDGGTLASAGKQIRLWDVATGQLKVLIDTLAYSVSFSPDGSTLASTDGFLWDVATGQLKTTLPRLEGGIISVSYSPDGSTLATGDYWGRVKMLDVTSGQLKATFNAYRNYPATFVSFSPDGSTLASGGDGETVALWDVASGQLKATLEGPENPAKLESYEFYYGPFWHVSFSPDNSILAGGGANGTVQLWDVASGQLKATLEGHTSATYSVSYSPDGSTLASGSQDGTVLLWDMSPYLTPSRPTAIQFSKSLPEQTALLANYPNPFNPETWIPYRLHAPARVRLSIFDVRGALVRHIDLGYRASGQYVTSAAAVYWDGRDGEGRPLASGIYFYRLVTAEGAQTRKMLLLR